MKKSHRKIHQKKLKLLSSKGGSCGNTVDVTQYTNPNGIIQTQDGYQNIFERVFLGPGQSQTDVKVPDCHVKQSAGGYTFDFVDPISNQPVVHQYADCCPPVIQNGQLFLTKGTESQCGAGRKKSHRKVKDHKMKASLKKAKTKSHAKSRHGSLSKKPCPCACRPCKCPKDRNGKCPCLPGYQAPSNKKTHRKTRGGAQKNSQRKPKDLKKQKSIRNKKQKGGEDSVFTADMTKREFGCRQPTWNPKCT